MNYKMLVIPIAIIFLAACSKYDKAYYAANIDKAESKSRECNSAMEAAFVANNKEKITSLSEDVECKAAVEVFKKHKAELAKVERELKRKEKEQARLAAEKAFQEKYEQQLSSLKNLSYVDFVESTKDCVGSFSFKKSPICKAYQELKKDFDTKEIAVLKAKYSGEKLEDFRQDQCQGVNYSKLYCALALQAAREQKQEKIEDYLADRASLKKDFNQCQSQYDVLRKANKWGEANASIQTYQCSLVAQAASKLKVYSFNKPIQ